jgi:hypothetical protein
MGSVSGTVNTQSDIWRTDFGLRNYSDVGQILLRKKNRCDE